MNESLWNTLIDVQVVISILTFFYYSWILIIMLRSTSSVFKSAFFRIFIVTGENLFEVKLLGKSSMPVEQRDMSSSYELILPTGFFDIQAIIVAEYIRADQRLGFGPKYEILTRIMASFTGTHFFTHLFGCLLMTINRYMAICQPNLYSKLWKPKIVNIVIIVEVLISFIAHSPLFMIRFDYKWIDDKWTLAGRSKPIPFNRILSNIVVIVYEIVSVILIVLTMYAIANLTKAKTFCREAGMLLIVGVDCLLGAFDCVYESADLFGFKDASDPVLNFIAGHYCLMLFLIVSMNSYTIILLSSELRKEIAGALGIYRCCPGGALEKRIAFLTIHGTRF